MKEDLKQKLKRALSRRPVRHIAEPDLLTSAVLIPVSFRNGEYYILFTKRTQLVKYHKGETSFPGGVYEERDGTLVNTARREAQEEIGLEPSDAEVLGQLDDIVTRTSNIIVSPFVAFIPSPYRFRLNPGEAESLAEVPITALLDKACVYREPDTSETIDDGGPYIAHVYSCRGTVVTGATARILKQFLDIFAEVMGADTQPGD